MSNLTVQDLLERLDAIGASLDQSRHALALIGLGSAGLEISRMDEHSDLDFFVIVEPGYKQAYIENLDWLSRVSSIAYAFQNTTDGYKLLFEDGIFCEFAVFELAEMTTIPFSPGRLVWKMPGVSDELAQPQKSSASHLTQPDAAWLVGEALTNLYVGLGRFRRGEKLSAARFVQGYAVDRILDLAAFFEEQAAGLRDPFANERRFEQRFPVTAAHLGEFIQGYNRTPQSALAVLDFLEKHFDINPAMARLVRELAA